MYEITKIIKTTIAKNRRIDMLEKKFLFKQNGVEEIWTGRDVIDNANYMLEEFDCYNDDVEEVQLLGYSEEDLYDALEIIKNSLQDYELEEIL